MREYEQRFGETLDEEVKIGVILALTRSQVQNHCHLNAHKLQSYAQVRTMLFDCCRAQADTAAGDVVPKDLLMLGKGKNGEGDEKGKGKGKGKKSENLVGRTFFSVWLKRCSCVAPLRIVKVIHSQHVSSTTP